MQRDETNAASTSDDIYCLRLKNESDWECANREHARKNIELISMEHANFDFLDLKCFFEFLGEDYYAESFFKHIQCSKYTLKLFSIRRIAEARENDQLSSLFHSFQITIDLPSFKISVFARYYLQDLQFISEDANNHIRIQRSKRTSREHFDPKTPLNVLTKFCTNLNHNIPKKIRDYFDQLDAKKSPSREYPTKESQKMAINDALSLCPGHVNAEFSCEKNENGKEIYEIEKISIVFSWAKDYFFKSHYFELDASFYAMQPYTFCVTQGILYNESIPLAITITHKETIELYKTALESFAPAFQKQFGGQPVNINWTGIPILSDMGKALCAIAHEYGLKHFLCHRHIIEHFGSSGVIGLIVAKILRCFSLDECKAVIEEVRPQIKHYESKIKSIYREISPQLQRKLDDLDMMMKLELGDPNSNYYFEKWALWVRRDYGVPRCSNHNESLHCFLNQDVLSQENIVSKLKKLIHNVVQHYLNLPTRVGTSIDRKIHSYCEYFIEKLKDESYDIFAHEKKEICQCQEDMFNIQIYGCCIPCRHRIFQTAFPFLSSLKEALQNTECDKSFNAFFSSILTKPKSKLSELFKEFTFNRLDSNKSAHLESLINNIYDAFHPTKPSIPFFIVDWNDNSYIESYIQKGKNAEIDIDQNDTTSDCNTFLIETPEDSIFIHPDLSPNENKAMRAMWETIHEIRSVYKTSDQKTIQQMCMSEYIAHRPNNGIPATHNDLLEWIAEFKMSCFFRADKWYESQHQNTGKIYNGKLFRNS